MGGCFFRWYVQGPPLFPITRFLCCFVLPEAQSPGLCPQEDPVAGVGMAAETPSVPTAEHMLTVPTSPCPGPLSGHRKDSAPAFLPATELRFAVTVPKGPQLTAAPALSGYPSSFCQSSAPR